MSENKTKATGASVEEYLASRATEQQLADCRELIDLCKKATSQPPKMWGPSIVGFGVYRYTYDSGRTGEAPLAGFAVRGRELVVYLSCEAGEGELLQRLGKHKMTKSCLYFKKLDDLDRKVLEQIIVKSIEDTQRRYP
ncbi:DUF1801 domain-containing protein [Pseudoduganella sp. OTU4001]|uniref:DUF1801 domain-containing protein n=1 Tax=Pseudoduganella sp. OTU4001 TaxID=3043854 RepID=UPI00313F3231